MQFVSATTAAVGANWTAFPSAISRAVNLINKTGTTLEFRRHGDASTFQLPDGLSFIFRVQANIAELEFRRVDVSNTQVTVYGDAS